MEQTYNTRAIILNRYDFREADSRIICYGENCGKLELVARGAKKIKSKSAGHLEPLTLSRIMVVHGKDFAYAGTAIGENFYPEIKNNLEKTQTAVQALRLVEKMTHVNELDNNEQIFNLLKNFLDDLEKKSPLLSRESLEAVSSVIHAQTGIQKISVSVLNLDSRLRGNDSDKKFPSSRGVSSHARRGGFPFEVFSQKLSALLGFSEEDFEELRQK
jgi:DNA repair protein RecO